MIQLVETDLGFEIHAPNFFCLFGSAPANFASVQSQYKDYRFRRIRQTHSNIVIESDLKSKQTSTTPYVDLPEADAHFTSDVNLALAISTADCIPILMSCESTKKIAAIHAGWRGIENRIVPKTISKLVSDGSDVNSLQIVIGPHILKNSFEISEDVFKSLMRSNVDSKYLLDNPQDYAKSSMADLYSKQTNEKYLFNLHQLLLLQIAEFSIPSENLSSLMIDTKTDSRFHSFRRDKDKSGRQISFIVRKF